MQSPFSDKFGIPRQPELVPAAQTIIALNREFGAESVRGLAEFDYIWVQFVFHEALSQGANDILAIISTKSKHKLMIQYFHNYVLIYRTVLPAHENALIVQKRFLPSA